MSEVTRLYDLPQVPLINGRSYKRVTSDMTVLISGTWGRSYKRVTSDMTVFISGTWGRSYKRLTLIGDRHNLFEGRSPIILTGRREKGMHFSFSSTLYWYYSQSALKVLSAKFNPFWKNVINV
jgi:hypothetical protein